MMPILLAGRSTKLKFQKEKVENFIAIQTFYWDVIENIHKNNKKNENLGWEKGIYPSDDFIKSSLNSGELYTLTDQDILCVCVILNSEHNAGYDSCLWSIVCDPDEVITPHALAVNPKLQGQGIGKIVVKNIIEIAKAEHKKAIRLDVLGACKSAESLYRKCGFHFVETKDMYYADTGWTKYKLFEFNL